MVEILPIQLKIKSLSILTLHPNSRVMTISTMDTTSTEKLEIKHENDQYRIEYEAELQLHLK